jgi:hypothetical protein
MSKSAIYTANTGAQSVAIGGVISPGSTIRRYGQCVNLNGNGVNLTQPGYYLITATATATPTAIGSVGIAVQNNGVTIPGATSTGSVSAVGNSATLSTTFIVRVPCCGNAVTITTILTGGASTVNNFALTAVKL